MEKLYYEQPQIEVVEIAVEQGFAASSGPGESGPGSSGIEGW